MKKERYLWITAIVILLLVVHSTLKDSDASETSDSATKDYHQYTIYENDDDSTDEAKKAEASDALDEILGDSQSYTTIDDGETPLAENLEDTANEVADQEMTTEDTSAKSTASSSKTYKTSSSSSSSKVETVAKATATVVEAVADNVDEQALVNGYVTYRVAKSQIKTTAALALTTAAIKNGATLNKELANNVSTYASSIDSTITKVNALTDASTNLVNTISDSIEKSQASSSEVQSKTNDVISEITDAIKNSNQ